MNRRKEQEPSSEDIQADSNSIPMSLSAQTDKKVSGSNSVTEYQLIRDSKINHFYGQGFIDLWNAQNEDGKKVQNVTNSNPTLNQESVLAH